MKYKNRVADDECPDQPCNREQPINDWTRFNGSREQVSEDPGSVDKLGERDDTRNSVVIRMFHQFAKGTEPTESLGIEKVQFEV